MKSKTRIPWLLCAVIIFVSLSQLPDFEGNRIIRLITYSCWGVLALCSISSKMGINKKALQLLAVIVVVVTVSGILEMVTSNGYLETRIVYYLLLTAVVFMISHMLSQNVLGYDMDSMYLIYRAYILSAFILSMIIYLNYFSPGFNLSSQIYAYDSKNSTSQIIITAVILSMFEFDKKKDRVWKIFNTASLVVNLFLLFIMRSRASIVGLLLVVLMVMFSKSINKRLKTFVGFSVIAFALIVFFNDRAYEVIVEQILFGARDSSDLNSISSGRFDEWVKFPELFREFPFFGRGNYKLESLPLSVLVQLGMLLGTVVLFLAISPAIYAFSRRKVSKHHQILLVVSLVYLANGLFEELSPFGPGVKCYFLWFLFGLLLRWDIHKPTIDISESGSRKEVTMNG